SLGNIATIVIPEADNSPVWIRNRYWFPERLRLRITKTVRRVVEAPNDAAPIAVRRGSRSSLDVALVGVRVRGGHSVACPGRSGLRSLNCMDQTVAER